MKRNILNPKSGLLLLTFITLGLLASPSLSKVKLKSDFWGVNYHNQKSPASWPLGIKVDLDSIFDLSQAKNPVFTLKNEKEGLIYTVNTNISGKVLLDRHHLLHRYLGTHIGLVTTFNELVFIETKDGGEIGESIVVKLFDAEDEFNKTDIHCFDMKYLRNYDVAVLGCLDDPQYATRQYFWTYHFATGTLKKTVVGNESINAVIQIEAHIVDMADGFMVYQPQDIPPIEFFQLEAKTWTLTQAKLDPTISSTFSYNITSMNHAWLLKNKVWTRMINVFQPTGQGLVFAQFRFFSKNGVYNVEAMTSKTYPIEIGAGLISSNGQLTAAISDDQNQVLKMCTGNPRSPAATFWQNCKTINNFSTGMVDLDPERIDVTNRGDAVVHYTTWPRETEGGAKWLPGSRTPLQPRYDRLTEGYNLNDAYNFTMNAGNIYSFKPTHIAHQKDMTAQFLPHLNRKTFNRIVTIECKDDDNKVSSTFLVDEAVHLGGIYVQRQQLSPSLPADKGLLKKPFGAAWKGNLLEYKDLSQVDSNGNLTATDKIKFNHQGELTIIIDGKPLALSANDKFWLHAPYSAWIKDSDPTNISYYETSWDGFETYTLTFKATQEI